ncbi:MAG: CRTAC1 family protein, partial [Gemmatimonadota bacterium]
DRPNALFLNEGGTFREVADSLGLADPRRSVGAVWFDFEEDGDLDLIVANMDGDANGLFRNEGGGFTDVAGEVGLADGGRGLGDEAHGSVRPCVADYDNDGTFDVFVANSGPNGLFKKGEEERWVNLAGELGLAIDARYDACEFGDFDHDGRVDLFVNGTDTGGTQYRDYLFRNTPDGFIDVTPEEILTLNADHGVQWVDFDADGDIDLSLAGATDSGMHHVLSNRTAQTLGSRSILVQVTDGNGRKTRAGAEVRVYQAGTRTLLGTRLLDAGSGYDTQSSLPVHFGLLTGASVDIEVIFPGGGNRTVTALKNIDPRDHLGRPVTVILPG